MTAPVEVIGQLTCIGCGRPRGYKGGRGLCGPCYNRHRRSGTLPPRIGHRRTCRKWDPSRRAEGIADLPEWVIRRLAVEQNGCWTYRGYIPPTGYVLVSLGSSRQRVYLHRYVYEAFNGPIPSGLVIDHLCRVPKCCNPAHLEAVTQGENIRRGWAARARAAS